MPRTTERAARFRRVQLAECILCSIVYRVPAVIAAAYIRSEAALLRCHPMQRGLGREDARSLDLRLCEWISCHPGVEMCLRGVRELLHA